MPTLPLEITLLHEALEDGSTFSRALLFPEVTALAATRARAGAHVASDCRAILEDLLPGLLLRRANPREVRVATAAVTLSPPRRSTLWTMPVELAFPYAYWRHGTMFVACVPALDIESLAEDEEQLADHVRRDVQLALARREGARTLDGLARAARTRALRLETRVVQARIKTPRQRATSETTGEEDVLAQVSVDLTKATLRAAHRVDAAVERLAAALTGPPAASVLLVGRSGVGKTALVHELVRRRAQLALASTPFRTTSGAQLVAGMSGFGMWQQRCGKMVREAGRTRTVLYLGNLLELAEVGRSVGNDQGIASFLRPHLARGEVVAIAECTPEQLAALERADPHLVGVFHQQQVEEPPEADARAIVDARVAEAAAGGAWPLDVRGLDALVRLHRRYATYSAWPGRPLRFLDGLLGRRTGAAPLGEADVVRAFSHETGLPLAMLDDTCVMDIDETRAFFAARVLGQPAAVDLVTGMLATVKARLTRPGRPIASLLFIGPTGVGKTETARALARFLFGDVARMTRFDMSEFADPVSAQRLVGVTSQSEGLLTARVREQPFSVVLLDEFEKGDPSLLDLLLQVLGDGRLTDAGGRVADFTSAVVILTSNLGAEAWMRGAVGFATGEDPARRAEAHFVEAVRASVRPELFNRIDRVVPFLPLERGTVRALVERELEQVRGRDGLAFRRATLEVAPEAAELLLARGYDARYGARPLKRVIEREVLAPAAEGLLGQPEGTPVRVAVGAHGGRVTVSVKALPDAGARQALLAFEERGAQAAAWSDVRRRLHKLARCVAVTQLKNEIVLAKRAMERAMKRRKVAGKKARKAPPVDAVLARRLARLQELMQAIDALTGTVVAAEDAALLALYRRAPAAGESWAQAAQVVEARGRLRAVLLRLASLTHETPDAIRLLVFGDDTVRIFRLAREYVHLAGGLAFTMRMQAVRNTEKGLALEDVEEPESFVHRPPGRVVALVLEMTGPAAGLKLEDEAGVHTFTDREGTRIDVQVQLVDRTFTPWVGLARKGNVPAAGERRRWYDERQLILHDVLVAKQLMWTDDALATLIELQLDRALEVMLES